MFKYLKSLTAIKDDCKGVTMLEYAIMGAILAAALIAIVPLLTGYVKADFNTIGTQLTSGASTAGAGS